MVSLYYPRILLYALIADDLEAKTFAIRILIHELAHVHDNLTYLHIFGSEPILQQGDWINHRQFIARSLWGEFFAESSAYLFVKKNFLAKILDIVLLC